VIQSHTVGSTVQKKLSPREAAQQLRILAQSCGLGPEMFFDLQTLFFISDAGSYPALEPQLFTSMSGQLVLRDPDYSELQRLFRRQ